MVYVLPEEKSNYKYHPDTNPVTHKSNLPSRYTSAVVAQTLWEEPTTVLVGFKGHRIRWSLKVLKWTRT